MHQVQSIDTVDNISVNRQRQVPRTGTAVARSLRCPHIEKDIEVPLAKLIDEDVEVSEIMQRHNPMIQNVEDAQKTW